MAIPRDPHDGAERFTNVPGEVELVVRAQLTERLLQSVCLPLHAIDQHVLGVA